MNDFEELLEILCRFKIIPIVIKRTDERIIRLTHNSNGPKFDFIFDRESHFVQTEISAYPDQSLRTLT